MTKDVYAIYESYILKEDGYTNYGANTLPGTRLKTANANNTASNPSNATIGMPGNKVVNGNISPSGTPAEAGESLVHKRIKKDIQALLSHIDGKKYQDAKVYCDQISKAIQRAHEEDEKKKKN